MVCQAVVVRAFRGVALNRWMVGETGNVAEITDESGAKDVSAGQQPAHVLGFPKNDIFESPTTSISDGDTPDWTQLTQRF